MTLEHIPINMPCFLVQACEPHWDPIEIHWNPIEIPLKFHWDSIEIPLNFGETHWNPIGTTIKSHFCRNSPAGRQGFLHSSKARCLQRHGARYWMIDHDKLDHKSWSTMINWMINWMVNWMINWKVNPYFFWHVIGFFLTRFTPRHTAHCVAALRRHTAWSKATTRPSATRRRRWHCTAPLRAACAAGWADHGVINDRSWADPDYPWVIFH